MALRRDEPEPGAPQAPPCSACGAPAGEYRDSWGGANLCDPCCFEWLAHLDGVWDGVSSEAKRNGAAGKLFGVWLDFRRKAVAA